MDHCCGVYFSLASDAEVLATSTEPSSSTLSLLASPFASFRACFQAAGDGRRMVSVPACVDDVIPESYLDVADVRCRPTVEL